MEELVEVDIPEVNNLSITDIQTRIAQLSQTEEGAQLKGAMDDLKRALKANPAACSLLLPIDIGTMVAHLKRMTNKAVLADLEPKKRGARSTKESLQLSKEELDSISAEDLL